MEVWRDVVGYAGVYAVSNLGNVCRISWGVRKPLKQFKHRKVNAYMIVRLSMNGVCTQKLVHRLVAEAFVPNPQNKAEVNHIDRNKLNNISDNLEWMTHQENINYSSRKSQRNSNWFFELYPHLAK